MVVWSFFIMVFNAFVWFIVCLSFHCVGLVLKKSIYGLLTCNVLLLNQFWMLDQVRHDESGTSKELVNQKRL